MNKVILIFLDGVGIGEANPVKNPFFKYNFRFINEYFSGVPSLENPGFQGKNINLFPVDANLGVEGLPQSGTGQVSILCGMNASEYIGKHFGPFPYSLHHDVIKEQNLFKAVLDSGKNATFVNAYPQIFFDYLAKQKRRIGAFAMSAMFSGIKLATEQDLRNGIALSNDITNIRWRTRLNSDIDLVSPETAAQRLISISQKNDLTVYEYYLTDHIGHWRIKEDLDEIFSDLDRFLCSVFTMQNENTNVLIVSDHGNFEDVSVKTHTRNPALCIAKGKDSDYFSANIKSLTDIKRVILESLKN